MLSEATVVRGKGRTTIYETWYDKLHHLPSRVDQAVAAMARFNAMEARSRRIASGLPPEPSPQPATVLPLETQLSKPPQTVAGSKPSPVPESHVHSAPVGSQDEKNRGPKDDLPLQSSGVGTATWESIEISFLSDEWVQIRNGTKLETRNYAEFGFEDRGSGKPNQAWEQLRALAEQRGIIREPTKAHQNWSKVEKRIQEIRKILRNHFVISSDPIPFVEGAGYQARFKIGCGPSYAT